MKKILLALVMFIFIGCCNDGPNKNRNGDSFGTSFFVDYDSLKITEPSTH